MSLLPLILAAVLGAPSAPAFLVGGDISMLPWLEARGGAFRDDGRTADALAVMVGHGGNAYRVRLFVDPRNAGGGAVQDLPAVAALARRIKGAGAAFVLDLHYSDTWADPGHQTKPAAWRDLDFPDLVARVEAYTAAVMDTLAARGASPDMVQIGNEITPGFLWPDGRLGADAGGWDRFATLLRAAIRGARRGAVGGEPPRIMLHVADGGDAGATAWFFRNVEARGVSFDVIGVSYYPWHHGSVAGLRANLAQAAATFGKDVMVVETAYPWRGPASGRAMTWPRTPAGQAAFLADVIAAVRAVPDGRGLGVLWWSPEVIPVRGAWSWLGGDCALFRPDGTPLPALDLFARP